jgi:hypothetical protein
MTSPLTSLTGGSRRVPATSTAPQQLLQSFPTYVGAERLVDKLSDAAFPVEHLRIVGSGLRSVEYVTGRLTSGRAALAGAATGAWIGLLIGVLIRVFSSGSTSAGNVVASVVIGAAWWAAFGYLAHRATRGRRDFASVKGVEAEQYQVFVDVERADDAIRLGGLL